MTLLTPPRIDPANPTPDPNEELLGLLCAAIFGGLAIFLWSYVIHFWLGASWQEAATFVVGLLSVFIIGLVRWL